MKKNISFIIFLSLLNFHILYAQVKFDYNFLKEAQAFNFKITNSDTVFYKTSEIEQIQFYDTTGIRKRIFYYKNGQKKEEVNFKDSIIDGISLSWHNDGTIESIVFADKHEDGFGLDFFKNGILKSFSTFSANSKIGNIESFYCENGFLYDIRYHDSIDYIRKGYDCNGSLRYKCRYIGDRGFVGLFECFYENGNIYLIGNYKDFSLSNLGEMPIDGQRIGDWKTYNEFGTLIKIETYGEFGDIISIKEYDKNGNLIKNKK